MFHKYSEKNKKCRYISHIDFPDRDTVHFDEETGTIDLEPLRAYMDHPMCMHYEDGSLKTGVIKEVHMMKATQADGEVKEVKGINIIWDDVNGKQESME